MNHGATRATSRPILLGLTLGRHENWRPSTGGSFRRHFYTAWAPFCRTGFGSLWRCCGRRWLARNLGTANALACCKYYNLRNERGFPAERLSSACPLLRHNQMVSRRPRQLLMPSRPREFHPEPLTDPYVILSHHTAPAIARRLPPSAEQEGSSRHGRLAQAQRR